MNFFYFFGLSAIVNNYSDITIKPTPSCFFPRSILLSQDWLHLLSSCMDISSWDMPGKLYRFSLAYHLFTSFINARYQMLLQIYDAQSVSSLNSVYLSTNWSEREVWDMFGIFFNFHYNLRRLLTDYGFFGFPLRKDFPITGYVESQYSDRRKNIDLFGVELSQLLRIFIFEFPWLKIIKGGKL